MAVQRLKSIRANPYRAVLETGFNIHRFSYSGAGQRYEAELDQFKPDICVFQHAACADLMIVNAKHSIPGIVCPQNLDALDHALDLKRSNHLKASLNDLANEITSLSTFADRLFISKVEAAFITGLGSPSRFYPYFPVGKIADYFTRIRLERERNGADQRLLVLLGSASHTPIRQGMEWLLDNIERNGLPPGTRLIVAGWSTHELSAGRSLPDSIKFLGFVTEPDLRALLVQAGAILLPKTRGFGAATRLAEMALANIPVIASEYLSFALDVMPNVTSVGQDWQAWQTAIEQQLNRPNMFPVSENIRHESNPDSCLMSAINHFGFGVS